MVSTRRLSVFTLNTKRRFARSIDRSIDFVGLGLGVANQRESHTFDDDETNNAWEQHGATCTNDRAPPASAASTRRAVLLFLNIPRNNNAATKRGECVRSSSFSSLSEKSSSSSSSSSVRRVVQNDDGDGDGDFGKGKGGRFFVRIEIEIARRRDNAARRSAVALFDDDDDDDDDDEHRVETTKRRRRDETRVHGRRRASERVRENADAKKRFDRQGRRDGDYFRPLGRHGNCEEKRNETRKRRGIWIAHGRDSFEWEVRRSLWRFWRY